MRRKYCRIKCSYYIILYCSIDTLATCSVDGDCQFGGTCQSGACVCNSGLTGSNCELGEVC